jgi:prepilin-type processing-associated H-X9-DG protein
MSMTSYMNGQTGGVHPGIKYTVVKNPSDKFLLLNEDPHSMRNASFHPGGTAYGGGSGVSALGGLLHVMHKGRINAAFFDGHAQSIKADELLRIQKNPRLVDKYFNPFAQ